MKKPNPTTGLRHLALKVFKLEACEFFYTELLGMAVEWRPDSDNIYLCSGNDNLALHRVSAPLPKDNQHLDHLGFILDKIDDVDEWHEYLKMHAVCILKAPKTHRDGARSFYCADPDGNVVQLIFHPPLSSLA